MTFSTYLGDFLCKTYFVLPRKALKWFPLSIVAKLMTAMIRTDSAAQHQGCNLEIWHGVPQKS